MALVPWDPPCLSNDCASDVVLDAHEADANGHPQRTAYAPTGLTGAVAAARFAGGTTSGAPVAGTFAVGDFVIAQDGGVWICTGAGSPGTWIDMSSGRELAYAESNATNAGISTIYVDITSLTISFDVVSRPVEVVGFLPYVIPSAATTVVAAIRDGADVDKATSADQRASAIFFAPLVIKERITIPGSYTRKVSVKRFGGSGTIAVGTAGSTYFASISAVQK